MKAKFPRLLSLYVTREQFIHSWNLSSSYLVLVLRCGYSIGESASLCPKEKKTSKTEKLLRKESDHLTTSLQEPLPQPLE